MKSLKISCQLFLYHTIIIIVEMVQMLERFLIASAQSKKEEKLMWEHGVARTDILPYKGLAVIEGKKMRVRTISGNIPKGRNIVVIGLRGFRPIVVSAD